MSDNLLDLASLAAAINAEHEAGESARSQRLAHYRKAGEMLIQARAQCPLDGWKQWIDDNVQFSQRQVYRYIEFSSTVAVTATVEEQEKEWQMICNPPKGSQKKADLRLYSSGGGCTVEDLSRLAAERPGLFGTVYADPPWSYGNQGTRAATSNHYRTMQVDEIADLPVSELAAPESHLHLWTTNGFLEDALGLLKHWGFEFKSTFVWVKPQLGIGNYWRCSHEIMLLGVRGGLTFPPTNIKSWLEADRTRHSAKPAAVRALIERVSPAERLELFGREAAHGWWVWGDQVSRDLFTRELPVA